MSFIISIDGPAGSGKGTIAKFIADKLGFLNVDTGAMYRSVTLAAIENNIDVNDSEKVTELAKSLKIDLKEIDGTIHTFLNGEDVSSKIRTPEVNAAVSVVSAIKEVRRIMVDHQRALAENHDIVMEGRDIGSTVFPNADIKLYLEASAEERAARRVRQNKQNGIESSYEEVLESIKNRDRIDSTREDSPLIVPENAVIVDTSGWEPEDAKVNMCELIDKLMKERANK